MDVPQPPVDTGGGACDPTLAHALQSRLSAELIETHISWILLAGERAYKLKKPVRLPFADFSTLASRRRLCEAEVALNRRLAPGLYLGVLAVLGEPGAPRLDGEGAAIDYLVAMRRFADDALLGRRLHAGLLGHAEIDDLADRLARFHRAAPPAQSGSPWGRPAAWLRTQRLVLDQLARQGRPEAARLGPWLARQAWELRALARARRLLGLVREGHGDLHLDNIAWVDGAALPFDCIEFDPALRWIDVMQDLSFATMDLQAQGRRDLAFRLLDRHLQATGDYAGLPLLPLYEVARALVRALAATLAGRREQADRYLDWAAARPGARGSGRARLVITCGLSGSGKSTAAAAWLEREGGIRLRSDVERKRCFGLAPLQDSAAAGVDIYTPQATQQTFSRLRAGARGALLAGYPVIVDAAFLRRAERDDFRTLAASLGVPFSILYCSADAATLRLRLEQRRAAGGDPSEADEAVLQRQLGWIEPLAPDEFACVLNQPE